MAKKKVTSAPQMKNGRILDFSGGMNNAVHPAMLNNNESVALENYSLDEKGTLSPIKGRSARYASGVGNAPINGISAYNRTDGVARLLIGSGNNLYVDTPRLTTVYDSQADWQTGAREHIDTISTPGSISPTAPYNDIETTQANFQAGTLTSVIATAAGNLELALPATSGNRVSPVKDIFAGGLIDNSNISWNETLNGQTLEVQTRRIAGADPTFARNSGAFLQNGAEASAHFPAWQDLFDADQLVAQYVSGGLTPATWTVSGGVLSGLGGADATLLKTGLSVANGEVIINADRAHLGGIVARHVDTANYYVLILDDDLGNQPSANLRMFRTVANMWMQLGAADVTWTRGVSANIRFTFNGTTLEAWFNGVCVINATDSSFTTGSVGLLGSTTDFRVLDFTVFSFSSPSIPHTPRYEFASFPHWRWRDLFDTNQLSTEYVSGGDTPATWAVSGGILSTASGTNATLLKTGLTLADGEIIVNSDQAFQGGIVVRHVDNNNYYMLYLCDDSGGTPAGNFRIQRRVAGVFTQLATANLLWTRGVSINIRFTFRGSLIEAWFNGVRVLSVVDTNFTTGGVGLWNSAAFTFRVLDFAAHQAQRGITVEEGTTNLLTAKQSSMETDLTGFVFRGTGVVLTRVTDQAWHGIASLRTVTPGSTDAEGWLVGTPAFTAGLTYTASVFVKGAGDLRLYIWDGRGSTDTFFTATSVWQRISVTRTLAVNATELIIGVVTQVAAAVTFWADGLQIEQKSFVTQWHLGGATRSPETLTVPFTMFNRGNWTVEGIFTPQIPMDLGNVEKTLFRNHINANNHYSLIVSTDARWRLTVTSGGVARTVESAAGAVVRGIHYYWQISGDGVVMRLCVNGVQIGTDTTYTEAVGTLPANMFIGVNTTGGQHANGFIHNVRISNRARTLAEHQAAFNTGQPLPINVNTTYLRLFDNNLTDSGDLWQTATKNGAIPGIPEGQSTGFWRLQTRVNLSTINNTVTPQLHDITVHVSVRSLWTSPVIDVSNAANKVSGRVVLEAVTPGLSGVFISSRSSANQTTWTDWVNANAAGDLQHTANNFIQVMLRLFPDGAMVPSVGKATVSIDGMSSVTLLASDFTMGGEFFFGSLLDFISIVNGIDTPRKYDGNTLTIMGGSPPRGVYVAAHKNRLWMLRGSRLHFSDLLNIESWPVLNFIDISPNDGNKGTGIYPSADYLVITKEGSIWLLVGDGIDNYQVRRLSADRGNIAPRAFAMLGNTFSVVSDDGIYFSDFTQTILASERLRATWEGLNHRRLSQAVSWFAKQKLYVSLPSANSTINDTTIVYDTIRQALYVIKGWSISCAADWTEAGKQVTLLGHSNEGQVSQLNTGQNNAGVAIEAVWESKHFDHGYPDVIKRFREIMFMVTPSMQDVPLEIQMIKDGGTPSSAITVTVPSRPDKRMEVIHIDPALFGIHYARSIGFRVKQATLNAAVGIRGVSVNFYPLKELPTIRGGAV